MFWQRLLVPGPPFLLGACSVIFALCVAVFIPEQQLDRDQLGSAHKPGYALAVTAVSAGPPATPTGDKEDIEPLLQDSSM